MYEMQGPRPTRPCDEPIAQLLSTTRPPPLPDARPKRRFSRPTGWSGKSPG
jgi:hypothetical protein